MMNRNFLYGKKFDIIESIMSSVLLRLDCHNSLIFRLGVQDAIVIFGY